MLAKVKSCAVFGLESKIIEIEVDLQPGFPSFAIVGLPDIAIKESRERVGAALKNTGFGVPRPKRITINLAPADIRKEGPSFDLPIAVALLACMGVVDSDRVGDFIILGELSLEGTIRPVRGVLPMCMALRDIPHKGVIVPRENADEAALVTGINVYPVGGLTDVVHFLTGDRDIAVHTIDAAAWEAPEAAPAGVDFGDVKGQALAKRGLEIAAAGGHNIIMVGPPGAGKTLLAKRLMTILPPLQIDEALEVTKVFSVAGLLSERAMLSRARPYRAPHHSISYAGLVGGGSYPRPGEISLAHYGVLFLDEMPEFRREVLEVLRQPLEDGTVMISRAAGSVRYPAQFILVAAMNPCPCGFYYDKLRACTCTAAQIQRYGSRISGPLLDRIDLHVDVLRLTPEEMILYPGGDTSAAIRERVAAARALQRERFGHTPTTCNAQMTPKQVRVHCDMDREGMEFLKNVVIQLHLSARAYDRLLKVARTIADLDQASAVQARHLAEAAQFRRRTVHAP